MNSNKLVKVSPPPPPKKSGHFVCQFEVKRMLEVHISKEYRPPSLPICFDYIKFMY